MKLVVEASATWIPCTTAAFALHYLMAQRQDIRDRHLIGIIGDQVPSYLLSRITKLEREQLQEC